MGLFSFVKTAGRKLGFFGGSEATQAEHAAAQEAFAKAEAARTAVAEAAAEERAELSARAVEADISAAILAHGIEIDGLTVGFSNDIVALSGTAPSQLARERAVLIAGNTEGVGGVQDDLDVVVPEPPAVFHTVQAGDTLSAISLATYGNMRLYDSIFEANKPMLTSPDLIYPGQVLRIPVEVPQMVHTVAPGDTLGSISKHYYGDARRYTEIFEANKGSLSDPNAIDVGQHLTIPHQTPSQAAV